MRGALQRYRVIANVVGVVLVFFVFVAIPVRYVGGYAELSKSTSQVHGVLYMVYLALTVALARRAGWSVKRTVLVMLAGTVPFLSFVVERRMTRDVRAHVTAA